MRHGVLAVLMVLMVLGSQSTALGQRGGLSKPGKSGGASLGRAGYAASGFAAGGYARSGFATSGYSSPGYARAGFGNKGGQYTAQAPATNPDQQAVSYRGRTPSMSRDMLPSAIIPAAVAQNSVPPLPAETTPWMPSAFHWTGGRAPSGSAESSTAPGDQVSFNHIIRSADELAAIRTGFRGYRWYYTPRWYQTYASAWYAAAVNPADWWHAATWADIAKWCRVGDAQPYEFGSSVIQRDGQVIIDEKNVGSPAESSAQAREIAQRSTADKAEGPWFPLGVFVLIDQPGGQTDQILQLAVNGEGIVRGNLLQESDLRVTRVHGAVDRSTQRVAFQLADDEQVVYEVGLFNLTRDVMTVLVHRNSAPAEIQAMVRLQFPVPDP